MLVRIKEASGTRLSMGVSGLPNGIPMARRAALKVSEEERDDLRAKLASLTDWSAAEEERHHARERELEAKLAKAARIHVESEAKHAYRVKELEAKLAEVERHAIVCVKTERKRAEAAEARVRELEAALHARGVYDPS